MFFDRAEDIGRTFPISLSIGQVEDRILWTRGKRANNVVRVKASGGQTTAYGGQSGPWRGLLEEGATTRL
jgi:hypothetical protein